MLNAAFGVLPRRMRIQASRPPYAQIDISRFVPRPEASFLAIPCQALQSSQGTDMQCMAERDIRGVNDAFATGCSPPPTRNSVMLVHSPAGIARRPSANHVINLPRGAGGVCGGVRNDHAQAAMRRSLRVAVHLPPSLRLVPRPQGPLPTGPSLGEARINAIIAASTHNARGATIATDVGDNAARAQLTQLCGGARISHYVSTFRVSCLGDMSSSVIILPRYHRRDPPIARSPEGGGGPALRLLPSLEALSQAIVPPSHSRRRWQPGHACHRGDLHVGVSYLDLCVSHAPHTARSFT